MTLSVGDEAREALVPAQSFLLLKDKDGEEITLAVGVKPNGRGSVSIVGTRVTLLMAEYGETACCCPRRVLPLRRYPPTLFAGA